MPNDGRRRRTPIVESAFATLVDLVEAAKRRAAVDEAGNAHRPARTGRGGEGRRSRRPPSGLLRLRRREPRTVDGTRAPSGRASGRRPRGTGEIETEIVDPAGRRILASAGRKSTVFTPASGRALQRLLVHHRRRPRATGRRTRASLRAVDAVVFPVDCVSHNAMSCVKALPAAPRHALPRCASSGLGLLKTFSEIRPDPVSGKLRRSGRAPDRTRRKTCGRPSCDRWPAAMRRRCLISDLTFPTRSSRGGSGHAVSPQQLASERQWST